ncbi:Pfs NACHT and ankyrin domain protein [Penicillium canariense]|uniref:Pfs NACHT and ankyrin domain protein n=1 Tax=Penicillium canariense TaxID=189055 RepID=A0A9W9HM19_9EURO|nr:Pfs NACHT and ankyrin domain protein [Penicillium canariense]KAJ5151429.1 Pfs NACHT and ankyrin domain protein [Penicillium canariense]
MTSTSYHGANHGFQSVNNHGTVTAESHLSKRRKISHDSLPTSRHDEYTIAWICALHIEMAAAQAMLDDPHETLPTPAHDRNTYVLGNIKRHNVVIACLPEGQYGTNNAATVMANMKRTFPAIRICLMVGIGGGVPSKADLRLGDIVVGTRVMQYDLGKIIGEGRFQRTATPRTPDLLLGTAVSALRSKHELGPSRIPTILRQKMETYRAYGRPSAPDLLFRATYDHISSSTTNCDGCDHSKLGNQVIKHGVTRDNVARELDVICFEMEAAGLMDNFHCLPVRGICDYSDSHKSKEWQRYAAATAAAYARELLEEIPTTETFAKGTIPSDSPALTKTCQWLLRHPDYETWLDPAKLIQHHGFLWISGKPGAGKSTIMKFVYKSMKSKARHKDVVIASFFFNARGEYLEKSISGMYRSLLLQLLEGYPDLQAVLDDSDLVPQTQNGCPSLNVLKDLFYNALSALGDRSFTCFIDALDECDEQQVVDMVQYFEDLAEQSTAKGILFRLCFSSRHYPYIFIQQGIRLILEDQSGHADDLATYVASRLQVKDAILAQGLQSQILGKAAGVFIWVVLVIDILNKEYRRGAMSLRRRLTEIPSNLSELFKDILRRDNENMEDLRLSILWILYANRPLQPQEFYHAVWSGLELKDLVDDQIPDVTNPDASDSLYRFSRYVISSSKGLAEITKSKQPTVQFIHESVRDFLIKDNGLQELWPEYGFDCESPSHETLKSCCSLYMDRTLVLSESDSDGRTEISKRYPFLEYASQHILYHASAAAKVVAQDDFLSSFPIANWIKINNMFQKFMNRRYSPHASLIYILAEKGFPELVRTRLREDRQIEVFGERYKYPLFAALANGNKDTAAALLNLSSTIYDGVDITDGLNYRKDFKEFEGRTPLSWAAQDGRVGIVKLLLTTTISVNDVDRGKRTPLSRASEKGHEAIVRLLIDRGANINTGDRHGKTPLQWASDQGHEAVVRLLIDEGADVKINDIYGMTPLHWASEGGHEALVRLLIDAGADFNSTRSMNGKTPLQWASEHGHEAVVRLLIDEGADVNPRDKFGRIPLQWASERGHEAVVRLLIDEGADVNTHDQNESTPLQWASERGHEAVVRLLIDGGADFNSTRSIHGKTPLQWASEHGHEAVVRLLIDEGADVNTRDESGKTPLQWASERGHEAVVRLLIDRGADVNIHDQNEKTPLQWASERGHEAVARLLIDEGADFNTCDESGKTPLQWASERGHEAVARLLIENGA